MKDDRVWGWFYPPYVPQGSPAVTQGHRLASTGWLSLCTACRVRGASWEENSASCTHSWSWRSETDTPAYRPFSSRYVRGCSWVQPQVRKTWKMHDCYYKYMSFFKYRVVQIHIRLPYFMSVSMEGGKFHSFYTKFHNMERHNLSCIPS